MDTNPKLPENEIETALDKLERPVQGDFVSGLRNFIAWVNDLVAKRQ